jgi:PAS domain-containing protein
MSDTNSSTLTNQTNQTNETLVAEASNEPHEGRNQSHEAGNESHEASNPPYEASRATKEASRNAEDTSRKNDREAELQLIINQTPFMLTRCSADLKYLFVRTAYAEMLGRPAAKIAGKSIPDVMGHEGFATILPHIQKVLNGQMATAGNALTGCGRNDDIERARAAGFYAHLAKPLDVDLLLSTLQNVSPRKP